MLSLPSRSRPPCAWRCWPFYRKRWRTSTPPPGESSAEAEVTKAIEPCAIDELMEGMMKAELKDHTFIVYKWMEKLRELVKSNVLGQILHIEGHYSNEHSTKFFSDWRESPKESPAGGLTGTGIHLIEAFVNLMGPASQVSASVSIVRAGQDPRDSTSVQVQFVNGLNGYFAMVRATPIFWRVHIFGDQASIEAIGENEVIVRYKGGKTDRHILPPLDSIKAELDAFAEAIPKAFHQGDVSNLSTKDYPISPLQMAQTIAMFESIVHSVETGKTIQVPV